MSGRRMWTPYGEGGGSPASYGEGSASPAPSGEANASPVPSGGPEASPASVTRDDVLSNSPFDGDLEAELAKAPKPRRLPGLTAYLGAGALLAAGFGIGAQVDRHFGHQATTTAQGTRAMPGGGMPGGGMPGMAGGRSGGTGGGRAGTSGAAGAGSGSATTGTVQKIDGKTIYVKTANGVVRVKVTGTTSLRVLRSGSASALKTGTTIVVQGSQAQDGTLTATSVTQGTSSGG
ncbi:hypothetical protein GCM10023196_005500 [Actinoallomurus vinaceus]|uniref:DUF5666 domain-containing protein n=1 Tax=Actinoallomurus vinaceus TaxID=1080074 RepID=A0ABP8U010_9ACTN